MCGDDAVSVNTEPLSLATIRGLGCIAGRGTTRRGTMGDLAEFVSVGFVFLKPLYKVFVRIGLCLIPASFLSQSYA